MFVPVEEEDKTAICLELVSGNGNQRQWASAPVFENQPAPFNGQLNCTIQLPAFVVTDKELQGRLIQVHFAESGPSEVGFPVHVE